MLLRRRLLIALGVLALIFCTATAWYTCTKGFTRKWRSLIADEFEKRGVELTLQRLTLDPFRGLVAQNVKLYDARNHRHVIADINEVLLGVNYARALRGGNFLDWVDLREATVKLPLDLGQPNGAEVEASRLNARLFLAPKQLYLARAEAEILGIQVYATGRLLNPEEFPGRHANSPDFGARLLDIFDLLSSVRYQDTPPVLSFQFGGDLAQPDEISLDAHLQAESVRRKNYTLTSLEATASYRRGVLELQKLSARDGHGEFRGAGSYDLHTSKFSVRLKSTLGLSDFARAYGLAHHLDGLTLYSSPDLDLTVEGLLEESRGWRVFGHVAMEKFAYDSVTFREFSADVGWMHGRWTVREMRLRHASGKIEGDLVRGPDGFHARLHGNIDPRELSPAFTGPLTDWLARFDFVDTPTFNLEMSGARPAFASCQADGEIHFGRSTFDGAAPQNVSTRIHYAGSTLTLSPFRLTPDQPIDSQLTFDLQTKEVRVEKMPAVPGA